MNKQFLLLTLVALTPAMGAMPTSPIPPAASVRSDDGECAKFSGSWKGKCSDGAESVTTLRQDGCTGIAVDGQYYGIGGMKSTTSTYAPGTEVVDTLVTTTGWNKNKSEIVWRATYIGKVKGADPITRTSLANVRLDGLHLVVDGDVAGTKVSCTYEKK